MSGFFCGIADEVGRSTGKSTVASGAATMKMISSTSITSMNGVTLISWVSAKSPSSSNSLPAIETAIAYSAAARELPLTWVRSRSRDNSRAAAPEARLTSSR